MQRYSLPVMLMHWLIALLIVVAFALGSVMTDMKISPAKLQYYSWHKWLGVTVLALVAVRLLVRLLSGAPPHPASMPAWQRRAADLTHIALYLLMFTVPLSGYFYTLAAGYPVVYLGLFELPLLIGPNPALKPILKEVHELLTNLMLLLVLVHIAAAFKHQIVDKDGIFKRILPLK